MTSLLSFSGTIRRLPYALWSGAIFFSQHLVIVLLFRLHPPLDWTFWILPLRSLLSLTRASDVTLIAALAYGLLVAWLLAALAFRRAADTNVNEWIAAFAIVPIIQIPAMLFLWAMPSRAGGAAPVVEDSDAKQVRWAPATQGVIAGVALTLFSVAVSALVFGVYGYGLFVVSPFLIGAIAAYFANSKNDISEMASARIVMGAALLGGLGLVATALEGIVCIAMASPLGVGAALVGGLFGRAIARSGRHSIRQTLSSVALLPMVFALEAALPPLTTFDTYQTIAIDAPPDRVWNALVKMDTMDEPRALPFRLGVAYPVRGEILGEGIGAIRRGEFSTGTAIERVTEWNPGRKLAFTVETDVPAMNEISPYRHVHAPHAVGYFRTDTTSFELVRRHGGGTEVIERTSHQLKLDPVYYWLPLARWIVAENNARVLAHIRRQAEQSPN